MTIFTFIAGTRIYLFHTLQLPGRKHETFSHELEWNPILDVGNPFLRWLSNVSFIEKYGFYQIRVQYDVLRNVDGPQEGHFLLNTSISCSRNYANIKENNL